MTSTKVSFGVVFEERTFDDVVAASCDALAAEGFDVLSTIDVAATLADRLDEYHTPYMILGACHPSLASWALRIEPTIGVLLPCNVVVRDTPDGVAVDFMDPATVLGTVDDPDIAEVTAQVKARLISALETLKSKPEGT